MGLSVPFFQTSKQDVSDDSIAAPILYVLTVIVGAALRPDYSHIVNAVSELLSTGAPNKAVLDVVFNIYNTPLLAFAIGGWIAPKNCARLGRAAMGIFIAIQIFSFSWGLFPMDAAKAEATFAGAMHNVIGGIVALATILMPLLMGLGFRSVADNQRSATYCFITPVLILVPGLSGVILSLQGFQVFGLLERATIGAYEAWILVTARKLLGGQLSLLGAEVVLSGTIGSYAANPSEGNKK